MAKSSSKKNRLGFIVGLITVIFAVVGIASTADRVISKVKNFDSKAAAKAEYEEFLEPFVMFDPDPFDDISTAKVAQLINAAIWSVTSDDDSSDMYEYTDGGLLIPAQAVTEEFTRLFGSQIEDLESVYRTVDMSAHDITYDSAQAGFIIPITSIDTAYIPEVYEIETKGNSIILSVGYIGAKSWAQVKDGEYSAAQPDKYMQITLREQDNGGYYIASVQSGDSQQVAAITVTAPVTSTEKITAPVTESTTAVGESQAAEDEESTSDAQDDSQEETTESED